jgi:hypothetical protein
MISEKEYKKLTNDLKTIKELTRKSRNIDKICSTIKTTPRIQKGSKGINYFTKAQKEQIINKLIEICDLCLDLTELEMSFIKDTLKGTLKVEKIVIEGDYDEAMEQLENVDIPEKVKEIARSEIRKHFKDSL